MTTQLIAIIGPTASGKSDLAMSVAAATGGDILSVDSMQVYRGMNIGTSKPTPQEQHRVRHHAIDLCAPTEVFTVADFVAAADRTIATAAGRTLILCGGTPLYYKALFDGLFEGPPPDDAFRDSLRHEPPEDLHRRLVAVDPAAAARIHANDTKRLLRALEVFHTTGRPISDFQTDWSSGVRRYEALWVGLGGRRRLSTDASTPAAGRCLPPVGWKKCATCPHRCPGPPARRPATACC
jgi:tRNA dimethylallyltransferase